MKRHKIHTNSPQETILLAEKIGARLHGGEVMELVSDLGGGKTTFVRGLAKGIGSKDIVRSPSFTLSNEYKAQQLTLRHYDLYRLSDPGIMRDELAEAVAETGTAVVVEWGDIVRDVLPAKRLTISIKAFAPEKRELVFEYPGQLEYLVENT